jgi:hypothetical protein
MRVKVFILLFLALVPRVFAQSEDFKPSGKPFATIFSNFHKGISSQSADEMAFELVRGYIGYEYTFSPRWYAKINLDIGSPDDLSPYARLRRYAYFKNAFLQYAKNKFDVEFGLITLRQFKLQETIWERRYLMKTLADEYQLGSSADLGVHFHYTFNQTIDADFTVMNGEGYNNIQTDGIFKYGIGTTLQFPTNMTSRMYYDFSVNERTESSLLFFSSYDFWGKGNVAGEFIYRWNDGWDENHNLFGMSLYGKYNITGTYQLFARFDKIESNILSGESTPWHLAEDGSALVAGIQFHPIKQIKLALNYHDWYPWAANSKGEAYIYLDLEVKM